jgi:hypothetical protein
MQDWSANGIVFKALRPPKFAAAIVLAARLCARVLQNPVT